MKTPVAWAATLWLAGLAACGGPGPVGDGEPGPGGGPQRQVTVGPVLSVDGLLDDPHVRQRRVLVEVPDKELGSVVMHDVFPRLSRTPGRIRSESPRLGEHQSLLDDPTS